MCGTNTNKVVERVPVSVLLHNPSRHIPWCLKARKAFVKHCVRHRLDFKTLKWKCFGRLLDEIHCDFAAISFQCATRSRVEAALRTILKKLMSMGLVRQGDGTMLEYHQCLITAVLADNWDGDLPNLPTPSRAERVDNAQQNSD